MFLVRTVLAVSQIHGLGVFAASEIAKGDVVWRFEPAFDKVISESALSEFPEHVVEHIKIHAEYFPRDGFYVMSSDNDKFMNHSTSPNLAVVANDAVGYPDLLAMQDIPAGAELTIDYDDIILDHETPS